MRTRSTNRSVLTEGTFALRNHRFCWLPCLLSSSLPRPKVEISLLSWRLLQYPTLLDAVSVCPTADLSTIHALATSPPRRPSSVLLDSCVLVQACHCAVPSLPLPLPLAARAEQAADGKHRQGTSALKAGETKTTKGEGAQATDERSNAPRVRR
jgi:hypothetical protein